MRTLSSTPFWPCDGSRMRLGYLSAVCRYMAVSWRLTRSPPLRAHKPGDHQQADTDSREGEQDREQPAGHVSLAWGLGACRAEQVRLLRERAAQLLAQRVGVLPNLTAHVFTYGIGMVPDLTAHVSMPCVKLLRQRLMLGVQIPPRGLLGPEGEHAQERGGQR